MSRYLIDLTKPLDPSLVFTTREYADPPISVSHWTSISESGFSVQKITLGTQSGTHIDAPSHFMEGGRTLDEIPLEALFGRYHYYRSGNTASYEGQKILLISNGACFLEEDLESLLELPIEVWVVGGSIKLEHKDPLAFHRLLAQRDKYLVEDIDEEKAREVPYDGGLFIAPLHLQGTSGAPCRVFVRV